jgi:hypothetical protein
MNRNISLAEFTRRVGGAVEAIEAQADLSDDALVEMARLWNTISYHTALLSNPVMSQFFAMFRDRVLPRMAAKWKMSASRGMSLSAPEHDIEIGGTLAERYRYTISDLHDPNRHS